MVGAFGETVDAFRRPNVRAVISKVQLVSALAAVPRPAGQAVETNCKMQNLHAILSMTIIGSGYVGSLTVW